MKKLYLVTVLCLFGIGSIVAQRTISGTVTDQSGETLIGANIFVKGTTRGTTSDIDGSFSLEVPEDAKSLTFTYTGFSDQEIALVSGQDYYAVILAEGITLGDIIVTGLGANRDKKSISYSAQEVTNEELNISRSVGFTNALSGKVAGIQLVGSPSAGFREGGIRIRGVGGLSSADPLYILDGTPVDAGAVNMDNVESVTVLKGAPATAIYGQRATGGVVVITSKKGGETQGLGIEINSSTTFGRVSLLPDYQNEYGGGYTQDFLKFSYNPNLHPASWASFEGQNLLDYSADESWGPRMDGALYRPYYSWFEGEDFGKQIPFSPQPNNVKDFFENSMTLNNNIAFSGGKDGNRFRLNYNNIRNELVIPNANQTKHYLSFNGSFDLSDLITITTNINYKNIDQQGNILEGYSGGLTGSFNQWFQRQIEIDKLRNYKNPDGSFNSWNINSPEEPFPLYWDNPYYDVYENTPYYDESRIYGNVGIALNVTKHLKVEGFVRGDIIDGGGERRTTEGGLNQAAYGTGRFFLDGRTFAPNPKEFNYEFLTSYDNRFKDFSVDFNVGANIRKVSSEISFASTVGGLAIPGYYNIGSSKDKPALNTSSFSKEVQSVYGRGSLGFKDMLYMDFTARNDWSSALPIDNNSFFYPSIGLSFVFSEIIGTSNVLSFAKVRGSYGQVGSDIGAHQINAIYGAGNFYGSLPTLAVPNTLRNQLLKPQLTSQWEVGLEMKFLQNRLGFDVTYYNDINEDQILNLTIPATSGYTSAIINAGEITREGIEVQVNATPVRLSDFNWNLTLNWATNTSTVEALADGLDTRVIGGSGFESGPFWNGISAHARVGEEWGTLVGVLYKRDANGNIIVNANGTPATLRDQVIGSILPDFTGGLINRFNYKGIKLNVSLDFQKGGLLYSTTRMFNAYSGLGAETVGLNDKGNPKRDPVDQGGGIRFDGVTADGTPNNVYLDAQDYYGSLFGLHEEWVFDASYLKIREVSLGYEFKPQSLGLDFLTRLSVSLVANNLATFSELKGFDPSELEAYWYEGGQLPQVRSIGFNISLGF
ncbi:MAG: SusC/RagA family TonB-linked outer membrane protein [Saprospiraceae bacterium]|nr:SusC/RagA family TonB-linked outer membrane protein [Saprospiraceae bacterium]